MKQICKLGIASAIEAIKGTEKVFCKRGVWNSYELKDTEHVSNAFRNSGYGADVFFNEDTKMFYVSVPCDSDIAICGNAGEVVTILPR